MRWINSLSLAVVAAAGLLSAAAPAFAADTVAPTTPGAFTNTAVTVTSASFSWTASTDNVAVTAYLLERCTGTGCSNFAQVVSTATLTYTNTGLTVSTTYNYRVRARDAANNKSAYSPVLTVVTPADTQAPTSPTGVTIAVVSNKQLNVSWTAPTDDVKVTGYLVERCLSAACTFVQVSTPTTVTYNNTGLVPNTGYSYRVRARDAANNISAYSAVATASTLPDTQAPTTPGGPTLTVNSSTKITATWTASTDDVAVTGYPLERCQGIGCSNFIQVTTATGVSYGNTGLVAGSSYSYRVRATDGAGNLSAYTNVVSAVTTGVDATAPTIPTNLTATPISGTQINLAWTASTDNMAVTNYLIERCQGVGCVTFVQVATSTTPSYNDTGRTAATTYRYRVRATDAANKLSGYSTIQTAATSSGTVDCD